MGTIGDNVPGVQLEFLLTINSVKNNLRNLLTVVPGCVTNGDVSKKRYTDSLRTRVTRSTKRAFEKLSDIRRLPESYLQREALEEYAKKHLSQEPVTQPQPQETSA